MRGEREEYDAESSFFENLKAKGGRVHPFIYENGSLLHGFSTTRKGKDQGGSRGYSYCRENRNVRYQGPQEVRLSQDLRMESHNAP